VRLAPASSNGAMTSISWAPANRIGAATTPKVTCAPPTLPGPAYVAGTQSSIAGETARHAEAMERALAGYQPDGSAMDVEPRASVFAMPNMPNGMVERESCAGPTPHAWWPMLRLAGTGIRGSVGPCSGRFVASLDRKRLGAREPRRRSVSEPRRFR
jgi:hypothetical protein